MKKIGILTHWSIPNFGAFLQAYALRNVISSMDKNFDVFQIAYMNKMHSSMYYGFEMHGLYRYWIINPSFYKDVFRRIKRSKSIKRIRPFEKYYYDYIKNTGKLTSKQLEKQKFDTVILGSDILWDYSVSFYGRDKYVFGLDITANRKISYAASFGTVKQGDEYPSYVKKGITDLDAISVRDKNSAAIVNDICGSNAVVVVDPTLLWDFKNDNSIPEKMVDYKYVAVYGSFFTDSQITSLMDYCRAKDYKIVYLDSVGDTCDWCDVFIDASTISPFEWCSYVKNAEILMTCTFHGLMFGLIYEKKILFNATDFMKDKATDIISYLGLSDILLSDSINVSNVLDYNWDFDSVAVRLQALKIESLEFLRNNI